MNQTLEVLKSAIKNWWWFTIKGLLLLVAGIAIFYRPLEGYAGLSILFSVIILGSGFTQIFFATANSGIIPGWGWTLASGIIDVVIGVYLISYPLVTMASLPYFVGFWLLFRAFYLIGVSFDLKGWGLPDWGWLLFGGIAVAILGFLTLYYPGAGAISITFASGTAFALAGILYIYLSFKLKGVKTKLS